MLYSSNLRRPLQHLGPCWAALSVMLQEAEPFTNNLSDFSKKVKILNTARHCQNGHRS
jgi:hypothetical protein